MRRQNWGLLLSYIVLLSLIVQSNILIGSVTAASSTLTYNGTLSLTTTVTTSEDSWPGQTLLRTSTVTCPFTGLALTSYDGAYYSGTLYSQTTSYSGVWSFTPATSSGSTTRTFNPSSGSASGSFALQIYAEVSNGVMTFIFNPPSSLLTYIDTMVSYSYDPTPRNVSYGSYKSNTYGVYEIMNIYCNTAGALVTVPKSSNPFQTSQTITFSGSRPGSGSFKTDYQWSGTVNMILQNQPTATPTPTNTQNPTSTPSPTYFPTDNNTTPTPFPTEYPSPNQNSSSTPLGSISLVRGSAWITDPATGQRTQITTQTQAQSRAIFETSHNSMLQVSLPNGNSYVDLNSDSRIQFVGIQDNRSEGTLHLTEVPLPPPGNCTFDDEGLVDEGLGPLAWLLGGIAAYKEGASPLIVEGILFLAEGGVHILEEHFPTETHHAAQLLGISQGFIVPNGTEYSVIITGQGTQIDVIDGSVIFLDPITNNAITVLANQRLTLPQPNANGFTLQSLQNSVSTVNPNSIDQWWNTPVAPTVTPTANPDVKPVLSGQLLIVVIVVALVAIIAVTATVIITRKRQRAKQNDQFLPPPPPPPP